MSGQGLGRQWIECGTIRIPDKSSDQDYGSWRQCHTRKRGNINLINSEPGAEPQRSPHPFLRCIIRLIPSNLAAILPSFPDTI